MLLHFEMRFAALDGNFEAGCLVFERAGLVVVDGFVMPHPIDKDGYVRIVHWTLFSLLVPLASNSTSRKMMRRFAAVCAAVEMNRRSQFSETLASRFGFTSRAAGTVSF